MGISSSTNELHEQPIDPQDSRLNLVPSNNPTVPSSRREHHDASELTLTPTKGPLAANGAESHLSSKSSLASEDLSADRGAFLYDDKGKAKDKDKGVMSDEDAKESSQAGGDELRETFFQGSPHALIRSMALVQHPLLDYTTQRGTVREAAELLAPHRREVLAVWLVSRPLNHVSNGANAASAVEEGFSHYALKVQAKGMLVTLDFFKSLQQGDYGVHATDASEAHCESFLTFQKAWTAKDGWGSGEWTIEACLIPKLNGEDVGYLGTQVPLEVMQFQKRRPRLVETVHCGFVRDLASFLREWPSNVKLKANSQMNPRRFACDAFRFVVGENHPEVLKQARMCSQAWDSFTDARRRWETEPKDS